MWSKQHNLLSIQNIVIFVTSLIAIYIFYELSMLLLTDQIEGFDESGYLLIRQHASPVVDDLMRWTTFLGDTKFVIFPVIGLFIYYALFNLHKWNALRVLVITIGCTLINLALKYLYGRERPIQDHMVEVTNLSFPSGHAMFSLAFYGAVIYFIIKANLKPIVKMMSITALIGLIISIGISRVYLGVHYTSDIVAGFAAGYIWLVAVLVAMRWVEVKYGRQDRM